MGKRTYRATGVKNVDVERLAESIGRRRVMFGMDAAKTLWYGAFMTPDQTVHLTVKWDVVKDQSAIQSLLKGLQNYGCTIETAVEATGTYSHAQVEQLEGMGLPVYAVKSKFCHDYAEIYDGVPSKHDGKAAAIVAELALNEKRRKPWKVSSSSERHLRVVTDWLDWVEQDKQRYSGRLEALMARFWPELCRVVDLDLVSTLFLLEKYGGPKTVAQQLDQAAELLLSKSRGSLEMSKIKALLSSAQETIGVPMEAAEREQVERVATRLLTLRDERKEAERAVKVAVKGSVAAQRLSKEVGLATAAVLVSALGDFTNYSSTGALVKATGLNLKERSSGNHQGQLRITKRGSSRSRRWLFLATLRWLRADPIAKAWFARKVRRDGGKKMKGIVALMRKLVAGLFHVARGERFDSAKLFDTRRLSFAP